MLRIFVFLLTNLAVMVVFGIIMSVVGVYTTNMVSLMLMSGMLGFSGAIISLLMSKSIALNAVRGTIIDQSCNDTERWLLRVVHTQSKHVGIEFPQVAIYESPDMNAFATGAKRNAALIAVSTGLLQKMSKDEIEAVLAHEITHITNGDMVTMTLIQGVINTFVIFVSRTLAQIASSFISSDRNSSHSTNDNHNGNPVVYFVISMVLELFFGVLANLITLWFSRYREFYADAGSAKLVGREKMIAALQRLKISCEPKIAGNMISFCIHGRNSSLTELFRSHPSLDKRIEALRFGTYSKKPSIFCD